MAVCGIQKWYHSSNTSFRFSLITEEDNKPLHHHSCNKHIILHCFLKVIYSICTQLLHEQEFKMVWSCTVATQIVKKKPENWQWFASTVRTFKSVWLGSYLGCHLNSFCHVEFRTTFLRIKWSKLITNVSGMWKEERQHTNPSHHF